MKKRCIIICILILLFNFIFIISSFATDSIIKDMKGIGDVSENATGGAFGQIINTVIRLIQVAGSGISIIVVTITGIKYMMASPNEKADLKKQAVPVIVGCVLLFASVNIVGIIADFGNGFNGSTISNDPSVSHNRPEESYNNKTSNNNDPSTSHNRPEQSYQ